MLAVPRCRGDVYAGRRPAAAAAGRPFIRVALQLHMYIELELQECGQVELGDVRHVTAVPLHGLSRDFHAFWQIPYWTKCLIFFWDPESASVFKMRTFAASLPRGGNLKLRGLAHRQFSASSADAVWEHHHIHDPKLKEVYFPSNDSRKYGERPCLSRREPFSEALGAWLSKLRTPVGVLIHFSMRRHCPGQAGCAAELWRYTDRGCVNAVIMKS